MNLKTNKKIIFIFFTVVVFSMNFVSAISVNAEETINNNVFDDPFLDEIDKELGIDKQQVDVISETDEQKRKRWSEENEKKQKEREKKLFKEEALKERAMIEAQKNSGRRDEGTTNSEFVPLEPEFIDALGKGADKDLSVFFNGLFTFGIIIAGFLAVVMITVGGIQYMSTDAVSGKGEGRERITYALMGLLLVLFSWILLNTINPDILKFNLFKTSPSPSSAPKYSDKQSTPEEVKQKTAERLEEQRKQDIRTIEQKIEDLKSTLNDKTLDPPLDFIEEGLIEDQISDLERQLKLKQK